MELVSTIVQHHCPQRHKHKQDLLTGSQFDFTPPAEGTYDVGLRDARDDVDALTGVITAIIPLAPARFTFSKLEPRIPFITPLEARPGGEVTITFLLTNLGEQPGTINVELFINDKVFTTQEVTVDELSAVPVTFTISVPEEPGDYRVRIDELRGTFRVLEVVEEIGVLTIESLTVSPIEVILGKDVTVSVVMVNNSTARSTRTITVNLDGKFFAERTVTLDPGQTETLTFVIPAPAVGKHTVEGFTSTFEVAVIIRPAAINPVEPLVISPREVRPGEQVTVTATIRNDGDEIGETDVILKIRGEAVETKTVFIPGGEERRVRFTAVSRVEPGDYGVQVEATAAIEVKVLEGTFKVVAPKPAELIVDPATLVVTPEKVESGEPVTISMIVANIGGAPGSREVVLFVDDKEVDRKKTRTLSPGETETVSFIHVERGAGTHTVTVEGLTTEFIVTKPAPLAATIPLLILFALLVAFLALLVYTRAPRGSRPAV